jgi:hypothetical protein
MEVSGQLQAPASWKELAVAIGQEAGWAQDSVWTLWSKGKSLALARNLTQAVQAVASRYTD